jgi:glycosyltransferase involved in cell wall biosynthesis
VSADRNADSPGQADRAPAHAVSPRAEPPLVSVLICTRDRPEGLVTAVRSVQVSGYENYELWILDQSSSDETERAALALSARDARVKFERMALPGKPGALNRGFELAQGQYVLLTDDDCEVLPGWIGATVGAFEADPRVGCVHGDVAPGPHDPAAGYIPICRIEREHTIYRLADFANMPNWKNFGIGASMALRREVIQAVAGCDPCIGPGAKFRTGDDTDIGVQVLRLGYAMHFCPNARVIHHGFRYWKSAKQDLERSGFAQGAIFVKHLRSGTFYKGAVHGLLESLGTVAKRALRGERPLGVTYPVNWLRGTLSGMTHRVDRSKHQFVKVADEQARSFSHHVAEVFTEQQRDRKADAK